MLGVTRVDTYDEALKLVNENPYGNGTAIFTRDGGVARQFQFDAQAGMVGVNVPIPVPVAYYSFGGWKDSLFGDLHIYGPEGIQFYTRGKVVTSRWPDPGDEQGRPRLPADRARPRLAEISSLVNGPFGPLSGRAVQWKGGGRIRGAWAFGAGPGGPRRGRSDGESGPSCVRLLLRVSSKR